MALPRSGVLAGLVIVLASAACRDSAPPAAARPPQIVQLNQGWSEREAEFYAHADEGTNLAPLDFLVNLPDPAKPGARFVDKLTTDYGFIASDKSAANPQGLPVGFSVDARPAAAFGDRVYAGITCSACHTRQLTYTRKADANGQTAAWILPVHGGPGLVDIQRFTRDVYDAFFALLDNDTLATQFAQGVLGRAPGADDLTALRTEMREFSEPIAITRSVLAGLKIPPADFGPGNLNALSQGNYNNIGLFAWLTKKKFLPPSNAPQSEPHFEGTVNLPPMWFAHADTWAQWFAEIHDPGPRNWVQSVSTSQVRPPKMTAALQAKVIVASINFDNIAEIQRSLELPADAEMAGVRAGNARSRPGRGRPGDLRAVVRTVPHAQGPAAQQPRHRVQGSAGVRRRHRPDRVSAVRRWHRGPRRRSQTPVREHDRGEAGAARDASSTTTRCSTT